MSTLPTLTYAEKAGRGARVDLDRLVATRFLLQANSGGGKSRAIRQLLEETHGRVQHLVIDPEGEFSSLREAFPYVLAGKDADVPATPKTAKLLCRKLMELGASAVLDLYELPHDERRQFVRVFLTELMSLPRALWRPVLVVIDEAHIFCPERGAGEAQSTEAVISLCTQGRKRGFCAVLATQRISKLHKDAAAELLNKLVGRTGLDVDVKRAGDDLGFDKEQRQQLKTLGPGEFFVYGPAISVSVQKIVTGEVKTSHPEAGKLGAALPTPAPAQLKSVLAQLGDLPKEAEAEARTIADLEATVRQLRQDLKRAQSSAAPAAGDERLVEKRIAQAARQDAATITRLRSAIGDLMKFVVQINAENFITKAGDVVDPEAMKKAIEAAVAQATRLIETNLDRRNRGLEALQKEGARLVSRLKEALKEETVDVSVSVTHNEPYSVTKTSSGNGTAAARAARPRPPSGSNGGDPSLTKPEGRILGGLAQLELLGMAPVDRQTCAFFAGYTENGHFNNIVGTLNTRGLLSYPAPGQVELTDDGRAAAPEGQAFESLDALHQYWLGRLSAPEAKVLGVLLEMHPDALPRADLAMKSGYTENGHFNNIVGHLSSLGIAEYPMKGYVRATSVLFPPALR